MPLTSPRPSRRARATGPWPSLLVGLVTLLLLAGLLHPDPAVADGEGVLTIRKTASQPGPFKPGDTFSYTITVSCSNTVGDGCDDARVSDQLPSPLVLDPGNPNPVSVVGPASNEVTIDGYDTFVVAFDDATGSGRTGLQNGQSVDIVVEVSVPADASADDAGTLTNTATVTAANATTKRASADVTLEVPVELASTVTKNLSPGTPIPAVPGETVGVELGGANTSNGAVDELLIQDPAEGTADPFEYLALTGIDSITAPNGADTVQVDWRDAGGDWHTGTATTPIPADAGGLLGGVDLEAVHGLRFVFSTDGGRLPVTRPDGHAAIVLSTQTRDNVTDIPGGTTETVSNTASSQVNLGEESSPPVTADDSVTLERNPPSVALVKSYALDHLTPGQSTTATVRATNASIPVTQMVIADPAAGTPDFAAQGITFDGFSDGVEWPVAAAEVEIQYTYDGFTESPRTSPENGTIPAPAEGERVTGYTITFTGPIEAGAYAHLPFTVTADPIPGTESVTTTNTASSQVTASTGEESTVVTDDAALTRDPVRLTTEVGKNIGNGQIPGVPGAGSTLSITGEVCGDCDTKERSTIGSEYLQISDPASPQPGAPTDFWNHFDVTSFGPTDVPANADMTVDYWNGTAWTALAGPIEGPGVWSYKPTAEQRAQIQGVRYRFTPKADELLPPGFNVITYANVEVRSQLRDGSGPATPPGDGEPIVVDNAAGSEVGNPNAVVPVDTDGDEDSVTLQPIPSGPGPDTIDKGWLDPDGVPQQTGVSVQSLTDERRTARITWGTHLLPAERYVVTDVAGDPQDVAGSVFDAWNLVRIAPITPATDPLIRFDAIASVELFQDGAGWVDITRQACTNGCDGTFGGYDLTAAQRASTLAVRLTYEESPTRGDRVGRPTDPQVGTGVARTAGNDRPLDLTFQLRQQLRSNADQAVLGDQHAYGYNTGEPGLVRNTVDGTLVNGDMERTTSDSADILVVDEPVNVDLTKSYDQDVLGIPPVGTPQAEYPLITADLVAKNQSVSKVRELRIDDPSAGPALQSEPFRTLNLYEISAVSVPSGATGTEVLLFRGGTTTPLSYTIAAARALTPADLADVTGVSVVHTGFIASQAITNVKLVFQLRAQNRVTGQAPTASPTAILNVATARATNPHDSVSDQANDGFTLAEPTYGVTPGKSIAPAERFENESSQYAVTLTGQPTGTVRTVELSLTDTSETFWNAFDFASFSAVTLPSPIRRLKVDALVGVDYSLDEDGGPVARCGTETDLADCWVEGVWTATATNGSITPTLPSGVAAADVRGLRISAQNSAGTQWERPNNPRLTVTFTAARRETLRIGPDGETGTAVPSTRPGLEKAPGEAVQGETTDTVDVHSEGTWLNPGGAVWSADADATDTTLLKHLPNGISVTKSPGNGSATSPPLYSPGQRIPYQMTFTNTGRWPITGLELADEIETDEDGSLLIEPRDVSGTPVPAYSFTLVDRSGAAKSVAGLDASLDENTGLLGITVPAGFVLEVGDVLSLSAPLIFRTGIAPGTSVANSVTATSDRPFDTCAFTTDQTVKGTSAVVDDCTAVTHTGPRAASPIAVVKSVRGEGAGVEGAAEGDPNYDDLGRLVTGNNPTSACLAPNGPNGFYRSPCVPITRPGGIERWQFTAQNVGNVPARVIAAIDTFPRIGDVGVVTGTNRGSQWATTVVGNPLTDLDTVDDEEKALSLYFLRDAPSSECNAADILNETTPGGISTTDPCFDEVTSREWVRYTTGMNEAELTGAAAVKFIVRYNDEGTGLAPGATVNMTLDTRTAWSVEHGVDSAYPIAWNSVASGTQGVFGSQTIVSPVVEPTRVGVATATGKLALQKRVEGADLPGVAYPSSYALRVRCTSGPDEVSLVDSQGADASLVRLQADGTLLTYNGGGRLNLPLYADCTLAEEPVAQGATVTYSPEGTSGESGSVVALNDQSDRTDIVQPAFPDPLDLAQITATNAYEGAGFTVSKAVEDGGAVDQDGEPVAYDAAYAFDVSCLFNGSEVVPEADRTFTLAGGEEKVFDALPAGATCALEETGTGGSVSTSMVVTQDGTTEDPTTGTSAEFTLGADDGDTHVNAVAVTNRYTVGAVSITKAVEGEGAEEWGTGPYEVRLVCTLDVADPATVYDATHTLSPPDDLAWTVRNLPTGADCTVTETANGGANDVTIEGGELTVGDDEDPALVTVTNTFTEGDVSLIKAHSGGASETTLAESGTYVFSLACTREVDGETVDVEVPGGAERTLDQSDGDPDTVTWQGLPTGAECAVEETSSSPLSPVDVLVQPSSTVLVGDGDTAVSFAMTNVYASGALQISKAVEGEAAPFAPADFTVVVECTVGGERVPLGAPVTADGEVVVPGDGSVVIEDVPAGAQCAVTSESPAGATNVDLGESVAVENGATAEITVTNTYGATGFTVKKAVEGATDPDGDPITYTDDFTFTASCTFLDKEVLTEADRTFSLAQGDSKELAGLPIGAECVVEETGAGSASGSSVEVTQSGTPVAPQDQTATNSGTFTLVEGGSEVSTVDYTNTMPLGAMTVTKELTGAGADRWGGGEFEVRAVCTHDGADPATVYDATRTLTQDDRTWTIDTLPVGASCVVTEPRTGGATSSTVSPTDGVTIGDDQTDPALVTVTNTFAVGAIAVEKRIAGPGAEERGGKAFRVELVCTREVDGQDVEIAVPGGAARTLKRPDRLIATYRGLPVGADCAVSEPEDGGAERTTIAPAAVTVAAQDAAGDPAAVTVTNSFDRVPAPPGIGAEEDVAQGLEGGNALPATGSTVSPWLALLALVLIAAGLGLWRRRCTHV